jgi:plasmid stabilization system protein ParE
MAEPRIIFSRQARADILKIEGYISERDGSMRAKAVVDRIMKKVRTLASSPGIGRSRPYLDRESRAFSAPPWIIIYLPSPNDDGIRIRRIVDGRRDLNSIL